MPEINILIKPASGICNLRCRYCFYSDEMEKRSQSSYGFMRPETQEILVRKALEYADGACHFAFQGGEPTLVGVDFFRRQMELEKKYNKKHVIIDHAIQTNGYVLDEEWCEFFAENNFLVGLSIDGVKSTHDAYRRHAGGEGTYVHTMKAMELLRKHKVDFNVLTVVNARTAPRIRRIYESYHKAGFDWQQYIACLDPLGEEQGRQEYSLDPKMYGQFLIDLYDLWSQDLRKNQAPHIRQFENYIGILMGILPESCEQRGVCSIQCVVEADGSVFPCDFYMLDQWNLGNIHTDELGEILIKGKADDFRRISLNRTEECQNCKWFSLCRGGCRRHREQPGTRPGENYFCKSYQMFFSHCIDDMQEIAGVIMRRGLNLSHR